MLKYAGVLLALLSVVLTCWPKGTADDNKSKASGTLLWLLPVIIFFGSGLLDTLVKSVETQYLNENNSNDFLISAFATAAAIGSVLLIAAVASRKQVFDWRSIPAGIAIGIPNYFSIWCLVKVLKQYSNNSSAIIPINNMGIVLFSAVSAALLFKEKLSFINWTGIAIALAAIALIAFG